MLEGPRKDSSAPAQRVRGKAYSDSAVGWFTTKDRRGVCLAELDAKIYVCATAVAITDKRDIKDCNVVRKLLVGELFELLEGPVQESGVTRLRGRCLKDGQEGWITTKGNAGTVYASLSSRHYRILRAGSLHKGFSSAAGRAATLRRLAENEVFEVMEGPREETFAAEVRIMCRAVGDSAVGWVTVRGKNLRKWSPRYTCLVASSLRDSRGVAAAELRQLEVGEAVELLEGPQQEAGALQMRVRAERDGAFGWVLIRDSEGRRFEQS